MYNILWVNVKAPQRSFYQWIYTLTVVFLVGGVVLRSILAYPASSLNFRLAFGLTAGWLALLVSEGFISRRLGWYFPVYLVIQSVLVFLMLQQPTDADFFAVLYAILGMQVVQHAPPRLSVALIALFTPLIMLGIYDPLTLGETIALGLLYTAVNALLGSYSMATRRAQQAHDHNRQMVCQLQAANQQLQAYSRQLEQLAVERERSHLARDLHDSVTQTIFSMTLTTQSAGLLLERNPAQVAAQLEHLNQLAQNALAELQELVTRLDPQLPDTQPLAEALRQHLAARQFPDTCCVTLDVLADGNLEAAEKRGLFRIVQEALNNIVKHACASQASVRLHLAEPRWIEIQDNGRGFDPRQAVSGGGMGLGGMRERAAEIGWILTISSIPSAGTRIRIEKTPSEKAQP